jgi:hypothetical protein
MDLGFERDFEFRFVWSRTFDGFGRTFDKEIWVSLP